MHTQSLYQSLPLNEQRERDVVSFKQTHTCPPVDIGFNRVSRVERRQKSRQQLLHLPNRVDMKRNHSEAAPVPVPHTFDLTLTNVAITRGLSERVYPRGRAGNTVTEQRTQHTKRPHTISKRSVLHFISLDMLTQRGMGRTNAHQIIHVCGANTRLTYPRTTSHSDHSAPKSFPRDNIRRLMGSGDAHQPFPPCHHQ